MLDVRRLRLLRELHLRGTLAEVARAVHQSPSSISQQLSQLEREAGVPLLRKVGRGVQLTPQAHLLVAHTTAVLERLEQAESDLASSLHDATGSVRVGVFQSAALALMPGMLERLATDHPRLRVTMIQREPETALRETWTRDFDLVVAEQYPGHAATWRAELHTVDLTTDAIRLAVPPAGRPGHDVLRLEDAAELAWTMEPHGAASRHWAEQACRRAGFEPDVRYETADLQAQIRLIETGHAVALLPDLLWLGREPAVTLRVLPGEPHRTIFTAARETTRDRPDVVACRAALLDTVRSAAPDAGG